jgi:hypothetical protein
LINICRYEGRDNRLPAAYADGTHESWTYDGELL